MFCCTSKALEAPQSTCSHSPGGAPCLSLSSAQNILLTQAITLIIFKMHKLFCCLDPVPCLPQFWHLDFRGQVLPTLLMPSGISTAFLSVPFPSHQSLLLHSIIEYIFLIIVPGTHLTLKLNKYLSFNFSKHQLWFFGQGTRSVRLHDT